MEDLKKKLEQYYGYRSFREGQEPLIRAILSGRDALGIMPTGGGKSICYQLPALLLPGITLVVSPLISLMTDQVMALKEQGIPAAYVNSTLNPRQLDLVHYNISIGKYRIIYIAPERLTTDRFQAMAANLPISMVAVDEAHCISQWGQDFRPSYLKIADFLDSLPRRPVVSAFTATATEQVREDIVRYLKLHNPEKVVTGFDRPNLYYEVVKPGNKMKKLLELLRKRRDQSGIVYCATRREVESVCNLLCAQGFAATRYHAGLSEQERGENQDAFLYDRKTVMAATNAFGMGIDKSNVSYVIHFNMPKSLESYYQEAGRAGRDGSRAECILLFSQADVRTARYLIENSGSSEELTDEERLTVMRQDYARLDTMVGYCRTGSCLRGYILDYFGQAHEDRCSGCGNCGRRTVMQDITARSRLVFDCILNVREAIGYSLGPTMISGILHGSREKRIAELHLERLSVYGTMKDTPHSEIRSLLEALEAAGYLRTDIRHGGIGMTPEGIAAQRAQLPIVVSVQEKKEPSKVREKQPEEPPIPGSPELYEVLRALRTKLALEAGVPAYVIFSNATLQDMAGKQPVTEEAFLEISGVGAVKAEKYGKAFVRAIRKWKQENT